MNLETPFFRVAGSIHATSLAAGLVLLPSGVVSSHIGLLVLTLAGVAAIPALATKCRSLLASPLLLIWLAWWLLWTLSLAWSTSASGAHFDAAWSLMIIPAVLPVSHQPSRWMWPVGIGVAVHALAQAVTWTGLVDMTWFAQVPTPLRGLHWYSPYVGLWAMASMLLMGGLIASHPNRAARLAAMSLAVAAAVGLALTMNRTSWVLGVSAAIVLVGRWIFVSHAERRWMLPSMLMVGLLGVLAFGYVNLKMGARFEQTQRDIAQFASGDRDATNRSAFDSSIGLRVMWWHASWALLRDRPIAGHGAGSIEWSLAKKEAEMPSEWGAAVPGFITHNPHCSLLATAIEQGGLGVLLLLTVGVIGLVSAWRRATADRMLLGLAPAWLAMLGFSLTHAVLLEPYTAALVSLLVVTSIGGIHRYHTPPRAISSVG